LLPPADLGRPGELHGLFFFSIFPHFDSINLLGFQERKIQQPGGAKGLLDETPELQQKRVKLRKKLNVLEQVEEEINQWSEL